VRHDVGVSSPEPPGPSERDVLSSLPRTRPQRRSAKRDGGASAAKRPAGGGAARPPKARPAKPAAKRATAPKAAPRASRPPIEREAPPARSVEPPSRTDVVAGTVQAATELAQAGLNVGAELVRAVISRLPRP
jgi:hypothetical protein